ncbi:TolC family protein, partial [Uliginosibacterium sediminicola]
IPLFDWGGRQAASAASQAALQSALLGYRQTLVNAVAQTEVALAELDFQRLQLAQQEAEQNTLQQQAQRQAALLKLGLASQYDALRLRSEQQQSAQALIAARASHALALVSLFKSLGGAPQPESEAP